MCGVKYRFHIELAFMSNAAVVVAAAAVAVVDVVVVVVVVVAAAAAVAAAVVLQAFSFFALPIPAKTSIPL